MTSWSLIYANYSYDLAVIGQSLYTRASIHANSGRLYTLIAVWTRRFFNVNAYKFFYVSLLHKAIFIWGTIPPQSSPQQQENQIPGSISESWFHYQLDVVVSQYFVTVTGDLKALAKWLIRLNLVSDRSCTCFPALIYAERVPVSRPRQSQWLLVTFSCSIPLPQIGNISVRLWDLSSDP